MAAGKRDLPYNRKISPALGKVIADAWLNGANLSQLADTLKLQRVGLHEYIKKYVLPIHQGDIAFLKNEAEAKAWHIYRLAAAMFQKSQAPVTHTEWERVMDGEGVDKAGRLAKMIRKRISKTGEVCWLNVMQGVLDFVAKIHGIHAAEKIDVNVGGLRVAGMTQEAVDATMMERLRVKMEERRRNVGGVTSEPGRN